MVGDVAREETWSQIIKDLVNMIRMSDFFEDGKSLGCGGGVGGSRKWSDLVCI